MDIYLLIVTTLLFSAFFSGMEIAFISSNKLRFELEKNKKHFSTLFLNSFYRHPDQYITTTLVGNNIALVSFSILTASLLHPIFSDFISNDLILLFIETIVATGIILFVGEYIPKTIFKANATNLLRFFSPVFYFFYIVLYPLCHISVWLSIGILRLFGIKIAGGNHHVFSKLDLDNLIQESIENKNEQAEIEAEVKIFQNALDFSSVKLRNCMVPRTEVVAVSKAEVTAHKLEQLFIETGHSKILIFRNNIDDIIGYIHSSEMLRNHDNWINNINPIPIVPETMQANKLMKLFTQQKKSIAVVVDEYGGTSGIVTLEDILEEIFGEIEDEHDHNLIIAKKINDTDYLLSGRMEIDKANEQFDLGIPESEDYSTIAGFILTRHQSLPKLNETIKIDSFNFRILKVENNRIDLIKLSVY